VKESVVGERLLIVETARRKGVSAASREFKCSRTTVYSLLARYRHDGLDGLLNQPRGCSLPIRREVQEAIIALKVVKMDRSTGKVQQLLEEIYGWPVSRQTVWRVLSARGLARITAPVPLQMFEREQPNQLWQLDLIEDEQTAIGRVHLAALLDDCRRYCVGGKWICSKAQPAVLGVIASTLSAQGLPDAILSDRASIFYGPASTQAGLTVYQLAWAQGGLCPALQAPHEGQNREVQPVRAAQLPERGAPDGALARRTQRGLGEVAALVQRRALPQQPGRRSAVGGRSYSVPPEYMGRHVWVALLGDKLSITYGDKTVASFTR